MNKLIIDSAGIRGLKDIMSTIKPSKFFNELKGLTEASLVFKSV